MVQLTKAFKLQGWILIWVFFKTPGISRKDLHKETLLILQGQHQEVRVLRYWWPYVGSWLWPRNTRKNSAYELHSSFWCSTPCSKTSLSTPFSGTYSVKKHFSCLPFFPGLSISSYSSFYSYVGKVAPWAWQWWRNWDKGLWRSPRKIPNNFYDVSCQSSVCMMFQESVTKHSTSAGW